jgi:hypothetical protein
MTMRIFVLCTLGCFFSPTAHAQGDLSVNVPEIGSMVCSQSDEPGDVVGNFNRAATNAGFTVPTDVLVQAFSYFCSKLECKKLTLTLDSGIGNVVVQPWEEPASVVEDFLWQALKAGHQLNPQSVSQVIEFFCSRRVCNRLLKQLDLEISGVGKLTVEPWHDPADLVESFIRQAAAAGAAMNPDAVAQIMEYFCTRRSCRRQLRDITLDVSGIGQILLVPWQEPAEAVEEFARQAVQAGHNINQGAIEQMMGYFCRQVQCSRQPAPIHLDVTGIGKLVVQPWEEVSSYSLHERVT